VYDEPLQKGGCYDFLEALILGFREQMKYQATEPVGVCIRVSEMQTNGYKKVVLTWVGNISMEDLMGEGNNHLPRQGWLPGIAKPPPQGQMQQRVMNHFGPSPEQPMKHQCT
jgi:hypothetical protein